LVSAEELEHRRIEVSGGYLVSWLTSLLTATRIVERREVSRR
jgi:hypothetical protein